MAGVPLDSSATQDLLRRFEHGDREAQERLFARHRPFIRRLIAMRIDRRLRRRVDPSDVVQETHAEAARRLPDYLVAPCMPFRLWLRQIARDRLEMARRRHLQAERRAVGREEFPVGDGAAVLAERLAANQTSPSMRVARTELREQVRQAVIRLPDGDREIVLMRNFEGLSNHEVAVLLDVPPATASKRYGRALLRLRTVLEECGVGGLGP